MAVSAINNALILVGGGLFTGAFSLWGGNAVIASFTTGIIPSKGGPVYRRDNPILFWVGVVVLFFCVLCFIPFSFLLFYVYISEFGHQGTWPVG